MLVGREVGWLWEEGEESGGLGDGFVRGMVRHIRGKWNGGDGGERGKKGVRGKTGADRERSGVPAGTETEAWDIVPNSIG